MIINGNELSQEILLELKKEREKWGEIKIASFVFKENSESLSFLKIKEKIAQNLNIEFRIYNLDENWGRKKIRKYIHQVVSSKTINGAIIQLPLPLKLPTQYFLNSLPPEKDIDCLSSKNLGKFYSDSYLIRPPAVEVVDYLKNKFKLDFSDKKVLIIGYGKLIGKPLTHYFCQHSQKVTVLTQPTDSLLASIKEAEVIIAGAGKAHLVEDCQPGAIIIDFGYSIIEGKILGDVNFDKLKDKASLITPTPGGTGPILVAMIFKNLFKLLNSKKK